jgi:hypothetical protein
MKRPIQEILLGPDETMRLIVSFLPANDTMLNPIDPLSEINSTQEIALDSPFTHQDGMSNPRTIERRHFDEISGVNWVSSETIEMNILWANVDYIPGCFCVPMLGPRGDGTCCAADYFASNLGWPRDNYWQMKLLMELLMKLNPKGLADLLPNNHEAASQYDRKIRQALANHLTWLFQMAVTDIQIDGEFHHFWRRSYSVNGSPKDGEVFQLHTQCYPFLKLCEYFDA